MSDDIHAQNLAKLCRMCANFLTKDTFTVQKYTERIKNVFYINISDDLIHIHPKLMCMKCYSTMRNIEKRATTPKVRPNTWEPHSSTCQVCERVKVLQLGRKKPIKPKSGRPKYGNPTWTRAMSESIIERAQPDFLPPHKLCDLKQILNPQLAFCICNICQDLLKTPVVVMPCEHSYCLACILQSLEGLPLSEIKCPYCKVNISYENIHPSTKLTNILKSLKIECMQGCGNVFNLEQVNEKALHEKSCIATPINLTREETTLSDLYKINNTSEISRNIDDAVLHVIKKKMAQSKDPNKSITFKTGGPRVSWTNNKYCNNFLDLLSQNKFPRHRKNQTCSPTKCHTIVSCKILFPQNAKTC